MYALHWYYLVLLILCLSLSLAIKKYENSKVYSAHIYAMNIHFTFSHNFIIIISNISLHVSRVCNLRSIFITITISSRKHLNANRLTSTSCGSQEIFIMIISNLSMMLLPIKECLDRDEIQRCCLTVAQVLLTRHQCTDIVPASIFIYSSFFLSFWHTKFMKFFITRTRDLATRRALTWKSSWL